MRHLVAFLADADRVACRCRRVFREIIKAKFANVDDNTVLGCIRQQMHRRHPEHAPITG